MSTNIPRYLVENQGPDRNAILTAFAGAYKICTKNNITSITLLVPVKKSFPFTEVGQFLGDAAAKDLCKGKTVTIKENLVMNLETPKTFPKFKSFGVVIGVYLSQEGLDILDSVSSAKAIVFLPWREEEGKAWLSTWKPVILGKSTWQAQQSAFPQDVEDELLHLTHRINQSTGLSHPMDEKAANEMFVRIKERGYKLNPEDIRKWALQNKWMPRYAKDFAKLAAQYFPTSS